MQVSFTGCFLLTEPTFELFRGRNVRGAIIQDQDHGVDLPPQGFGNYLMLHKGLEIDKGCFISHSQSPPLPTLVTGRSDVYDSLYKDKVQT